MLENGAYIRFIKQMLGHANLKTTQTYTKVSIAQSPRIHEMTHTAESQSMTKAILWGNCYP